MKQPKRVLVLRSSEYRWMIHGLTQFRNKLIAQDRYPDAINELLVKLQRTRWCHHGNRLAQRHGAHLIQQIVNA